MGKKYLYLHTTFLGSFELIHLFPVFFADGLAAFRAFLKSEFCEENIDFWLACEDFKKIKSPQKLTVKAKKIYNDFIEKEAPKEVSGSCPKKSIKLLHKPMV